MALASLVQQHASASTSAAPTSFTTAAFTATTKGNLLVACVAYATSGAPSITAPAGWSAVSSATGESAGNTIGGRIYAYPDNPGGITTVAFTSLSGINGIAVSIYEFTNAAAADLSGATYSNSSTAPSASLTPVNGNEVYVGFEADLTGQAFTNTSTALFVAGTTATSTTGASNVVIRPYYALPGPVAPGAGDMVISGTLAAALACGVSVASFESTETGPEVLAVVGGRTGLMTGYFFQGMIGG